MKSAKILIATGNKGKFDEISSLLQNSNFTCIPTFEYKLEEPREDGKDFAQNSLIKAKYYANKTGLLSLADDSGLCVDALDGKPGIHSARWAIDEVTGKRDFNLAFNKIAAELEKKSINLENNKIIASFICNLTIFNPVSNNHKSFEGKVEGVLTFPAKGSKGFGYDPIFIANIFKNKTFAQIEYKDKESVSHRSGAFKQLNHFLNSVEFNDF
jgi:XTP/dITP diphosphohydrolase